MMSKLNIRRELLGKILKIKCPVCGKEHLYRVSEKDLEEIAQRGVSTIAIPCSEHILLVAFDGDGNIRSVYVHKPARSEKKVPQFHKEIKVKIVNQGITPLPDIDLIIIYPIHRIIDISLAHTREKNLLMKLFQEALILAGAGIKKKHIGEKIAYFISNSNSIVFVNLSPLSKTTLEALEILSYNEKGIIRANIIRDILEFSLKLDKLTPYAQETILRILNANKLRVMLVSESAIKFAKTTLKILLKNKFQIVDEMLKHDLLSKNLTIAEIASALNRPISEVLQILRELEKRGIVRIMFR